MVPNRNRVRQRKFPQASGDNLGAYAAAYLLRLHAECNGNSSATGVQLEAWLIPACELCRIERAYSGTVHARRVSDRGKDRFVPTVSSQALQRSWQSMDQATSVRQPFL